MKTLFCLFLGLLLALSSIAQSPGADVGPPLTEVAFVKHIPAFPVDIDEAAYSELRFEQVYLQTTILKRTGEVQVKLQPAEAVYGISTAPSEFYDSHYKITTLKPNERSTLIRVTVKGKEVKLKEHHKIIPLKEVYIE